MLSFVTVLSTALDDAQRRLVKFIRLGKDDVRESRQVAPFGIDSNPIKDMAAIYADTGVKGQTIIIGYLNKKVLADIGETRLFSTDKNGEQKTYIWLKNDGTMEVGGNSDFLVRYSGLESEFNKLKDAFNQFASQYAPGGPSTQGLPAAISQVNADISLAKISELKTL